jgi:hypothetical protein
MFATTKNDLTEDGLRDPKSILSDVKEASVDADELSLAKQPIM